MDSNFILHPGESFIATRDHLQEHLQNMRRFYRQADLMEMATSLAAYSTGREHGNMVSLQVVPAEGWEEHLTFRRDSSSGRVYLVEGLCTIVAGNLRFRGGGILKAQCPPYKCELITADHAEQLLAMTIENSVRYDPDPISEALHYKRLLDEEGLSYVQISERTGRAYQTIANRLPLLELDDPIQKLIVEGKLHSDVRVAKALLSIADKKARLKLAEKMAAEGMSINAIVAACKSVQTGLASQDRRRGRERDPRPMVGNAEGQAGRVVDEPQMQAPIPWETIRENAHLMCTGCEIKQRRLTHVLEPAWTQIAHAADQVCNDCNVRDIAGVCKQCPGVELLKRLILNVEGKERIMLPVVQGNGNGKGTHVVVGR